MNTVKDITYLVFKHRNIFLYLVLVIFRMNDNVMQK